MPATGTHHTSYASELRLHTRGERVRLALCVAALAALPFVLNNYWLSIANAIGIAAIGAIGLNILVGFTGQISLGQGGFLAVGAFTSALLAERAGLPLPLSVAGAAALGAIAARNVFRSALGRSFMAVRDQEIAAQAIGVNLTRAKLTAFALSSGYVGLAGALTAHYTEIVTWERYTIDVSVLHVGMIIVGGLGSIAGSIYGAAFLMLVPPLLSALADAVRDTAPFLAEQLPALQAGAVGVVIIVFLLFEPRGLDRLWRRVREYFAAWPFRY